MGISVDVVLQRIREEVRRRPEQIASATQSLSPAPSGDAYAEAVAEMAGPEPGALPARRKLVLDLTKLGAISCESTVDLDHIPTHLLELDGEEFVRSAYMSVLNRAVDEEGLKYCTEMLNRNSSKIEILSWLRNSEEGKSVAAPIGGLPSRRHLRWQRFCRIVDRLMFANPKSQCHVDELLSYENKRFLEAAYGAILRRPIDTNGRMHYSNLLQKGSSKIELVIQLRYSEEGRRAKVRIYGLTLPYIFQRVGRIPVLGRFFRLFAALWSLPKLERHQRVLETQVLRLADDERERSRQLQLILLRALRDLEDGYNQLLPHAATVSERHGIRESHLD